MVLNKSESNNPKKRKKNKTTFNFLLRFFSDFLKIKFRHTDRDWMRFRWHDPHSPVANGSHAVYRCDCLYFVFVILVCCLCSVWGDTARTANRIGTQEFLSTFSNSNASPRSAPKPYSAAYVSDSIFLFTYFVVIGAPTNSHKVYVLHRWWDVWLRHWVNTRISFINHSMKSSKSFFILWQNVSFLCRIECRRYLRANAYAPR